MIQGERVILRPIEPRDVPLLRAWQNDPAVMTGWALPHPLLAHDQFDEDFAGRFRQFDTAGHFIVEVDSVAVGRIDFHGFDERHRGAEISLYIGETSAWGRGYARDAVATLATYLFRERRAARVSLTVIESNDRARKLYEAVGFQVEGVLRDHIHFNGAYHNEIVMALYGAGDIRSGVAG